MAMPRLSAEQIGHEKLAPQPLAEGLSSSVLGLGALPPREVQNCPPKPLSSSPITCPCPKPQANTLNRTLKYSIQAMSERSERASFMAATLPSNRKKAEARLGSNRLARKPLPTIFYHERHPCRSSAAPLSIAGTPE